MKWIIGIIFIVLGVVLVLKAEWFLRVFGRIAWAEEKLGTEGGTRVFFKILGIGLILFSFLLMSGVFYRILDSIFGRGLGG